MSGTRAARRRSPSLIACALIALAPYAAAQPADDQRLDAYVREALRSNPVMDAGMQALLASDLEARATRARRLPALGLEARYTRATGGRTIDFPAGQLFNPIHETLNRLLEERGEPAMFPTDLRDIEEPLLRPREQETKLTLRAPLYAPEIGAAIAARAAATDAARAGLEVTARTLVREVKRAYFGAARADAAEGILEASRDLLAEDLRIAKVMEREGTATHDRVLRARAEMLAVEQRLDAARAGTRQARRQLARLLGRDDAAGLVLPEAEPDGTPAPAPADPGPDAEVDTVSSRPELARLDAAIAGAEAQVDAGQARRLPELSLAADYGIQGADYAVDSSDDSFGTVSLVLRWNLFDFGARRVSRDAAAAEAARLRAQRDDLERELRLALQAANEDLDVAARAVRTARARVEAAEAAFAIAERKRAEASLSQVAFIDAQRALTEARLNAVITRFDLRDRIAEVEFVAAAYPLPALPLSAKESSDEDAPDLSR